MDKFKKRKDEFKLVEKISSSTYFENMYCYISEGNCHLVIYLLK